MHKTPTQIARSLRAFRNAHRLGLLRSVCISPGPGACDAARSQYGFEYLGNIVPRLPLAECTCEHCECKYVPLGSKQLHRLRVGYVSKGDSPLKDLFLEAAHDFAGRVNLTTLSHGEAADDFSPRAHELDG
jgi:hypothetical protein